MVSLDHIDVKTYDDVIKWTWFPHDWPFVRGSHKSSLVPLTKDEWCGVLMFCLMIASSCWTYTRVAVISLISPGATYMRQWTVAALAQIMACRLLGAKPLSKLMLGYCHMKTSSAKFRPFCPGGGGGGGDKTPWRCGVVTLILGIKFSWMACWWLFKIIRQLKVLKSSQMTRFLNQGKLFCETLLSLYSFPEIQVNFPS